MADVVIDSDGALEATLAQADDLYRRITERVSEADRKLE
jgi:dephospho-CoA kinase